MSSSSALNTAVPVFQGANFRTWQQAMGDYLKSQRLWFHVTADAIAMLLPTEIAQIAPIHKGYKIDWTS